MAWFSIIVVAIMAVFALVGIIDNVFLKDKLGLGPEFKRGIEMIGALCLSIVGIISFAPIIAWVIQHSIAYAYTAMGMNPAMSATGILAMDMGGYQVVQQLTDDPKFVQWAGIVYGSMMGATIVFSIPVGLAAIQKKDIAHFSKGILCGLAAIPFGTFVGGLMIGIDILTVLLNLIIPTALSAIIIVCLIIWPNGTVKVFKWFSIFVNAFAILALGVAMVKDLVLTPIFAQTGVNMADIPFFNLLAPTSDGIGVAGSVGLVLAGALPFVACLNKLLKKPLKALSNKTGMSEYGVLGILLSAANNMATFAILEKMKDREKVINVAWAVCGAFIIGDHLAFTAGVDPSAIPAMMVSKLVAGVIAILIAFLLTMNMKNKPEAAATPEEAK